MRAVSSLFIIIFYLITSASSNEYLQNESQYKSSYQTLGFLMRSVVLCSKSKEEAIENLDKIPTPTKNDDLKKFSDSNKEKLSAWMKDGAIKFNSLVASNGASVACKMAKRLGLSKI